MKLSVSYLNVKRKDVADVISMLDLTPVDFIHVDVMDGKYVENKANLFSFVESIGKFTRKRLDIHFMVNKPLKVIDDYASLNAYCMTFHVDINDDLNKVIDKTKSYGIKVGLAINPDTRIYTILPYINDIDLVLVMSVVPGEGGQAFIKDVVKKIDELKALQRKYKYVINVDGGINNETIKLVNSDMIVSGSYITMSDNFNENINKLKERILK